MTHWQDITWCTRASAMWISRHHIWWPRTNIVHTANARRWASIGNQRLAKWSTIMRRSSISRIWSSTSDLRIRCLVQVVCSWKCKVRRSCCLVSNTNMWTIQHWLSAQETIISLTLTRRFRWMWMVRWAINSIWIWVITPKLRSTLTNKT